MTKANKTLRQTIAAPMMAIALTFTAAGAANMTMIAPAEAGKVKFIKKGGKLVLKGIGKVGKAASKSKIKGVRKAGKGMQKASKKGTKGIDKASKGANKLLRKTKTGRKIDKTWRHAKRIKAKGLNKAFRNCRGKACNLGKGAADFVLPL